jgi:hypothetical protein
MPRLVSGEVHWNLKNLVLRARFKNSGFAGEDSDLFWSTGVLECWKKPKP